MLGIKSSYILKIAFFILVPLLSCSPPQVTAPVKAAGTGGTSNGIPTDNKTYVTTPADKCPSPSTGANLALIDATELNVAAPVASTNNYTNGPNTLQLDFNPIDSPKDNLTADYVHFRICLADTASSTAGAVANNNAACSCIEKDSGSFSEELLLPSCMQNKTLNIYVASCAEDLRLKDPKQACGKEQMSFYQQNASSSPSNPDLVKAIQDASTIQQVRFGVALRLKPAAEAFLQYLQSTHLLEETKDPNQKQTLQGLKFLADTLVQDTRSVAAIFSNYLLDSFQVAADQLKTLPVSTNTTSDSAAYNLVGEATVDPCAPQGSGSGSGGSWNQPNGSLSTYQPPADLFKFKPATSGTTETPVDSETDTNTDAGGGGSKINTTQTILISLSALAGVFVVYSVMKYFLVKGENSKASSANIRKGLFAKAMTAGSVTDAKDFFSDNAVDVVIKRRYGFTGDYRVLIRDKNPPNKLRDPEPTDFKDGKVPVYTAEQIKTYMESPERAATLERTGGKGVIATVIFGGLMAGGLGYFASQANLAESDPVALFVAALQKAASDLTKLRDASNMLNNKMDALTQ